MKSGPGRLTISLLGTLVALTGCSTFTMWPVAARPGPPVKLTSNTPCPTVDFNANESLALIFGLPPDPGGFQSSFAFALRGRSWTGAIRTYASVVADPMNPDPVMAPGSYWIQPICQTNGYHVVQTYLQQHLRVLPARTFSAVVTSRRGARIVMTGTGCRSEETVVAGILPINQPERAFDDPKLVKYVGDHTVDAHGGWSMAIHITSTAPTGSYYVRAECQAVNGDVDIGYASRRLIVYP